MTPSIETEALQALENLRSEVTDEDLHESGRYFADCCRDLTQCGHGDTGEYRAREDGRAIALLWNLWRSGAIHRNAAELVAARAEIERQREYIAGRVYDC